MISNTSTTSDTKTSFETPIKIIIVRINWLLNQLKTHPIGYAVGFFILIALLYLFYPHMVSLGVLAASFGTIFVALKYKLDQANYHKSLFEERYRVFELIDQILYDCFHDTDKNGQTTNWQNTVEKLKSIHRKSYFLFSVNTYQFISEFQQAVITYKMLNDKFPEKTKEAESFLISLIDGQKLSAKFPELKIDTY